MPDAKDTTTSAAETTPAAKTETVTLTGAHTHQGQRRREGDKIQVTAGQKAFLKRIGKIA